MHAFAWREHLLLRCSNLLEPSYLRLFILRLEYSACWRHSQVCLYLVGGILLGCLVSFWPRDTTGILMPSNHRRILVVLSEALEANDALIAMLVARWIHSVQLGLTLMKVTRGALMSHLSHLNRPGVWKWLGTDWAISKDPWLQWLVSRSFPEGNLRRNTSPNPTEILLQLTFGCCS